MNDLGIHTTWYLKTRIVLILDFAKPSAHIYVDAVGLNDNEYNSVMRQTRVKNRLASLRVDHLTDTNTDAAAAFAEVYKHIFSMSRQVF